MQNEVLDEPADVVVGKCGGDGCLEPETTAQAAGDIIFAAAFPDLEFARATDAAFARVEPEHDFSQRDHVVFAGAGRFDVEGHGQRFRLMGMMQHRLSSQPSGLNRKSWTVATKWT